MLSTKEGYTVIHYVDIHQEGKEPTRFFNNDGTEQTDRDDKVVRVEITAEQHFGLILFHDDSGRAMIQLRRGGEVTEPISFAELGNGVAQLGVTADEGS